MTPKLKEDLDRVTVTFREAVQQVKDCRGCSDLLPEIFNQAVVLVFMAHGGHHNVYEKAENFVRTICPSFRIGVIQ